MIVKRWFYPYDCNNQDWQQYIVEKRSLLSTFHTKGWPSKASLKGLGHGEIAAVCEWCLHQFVLHSKVLKPIVELSIGHVDTELLQGVALLGVKVEPHLAQPIKGLGVGHLVLDQVSGHCPLVDKLTDLKAMIVIRKIPCMSTLNSSSKA